MPARGVVSHASGCGNDAGVALFFFSIVENGGRRRDDATGETFETLDEARVEAMYGALTIAEELASDAPKGMVEIEIIDEAGTVVGRAGVSFDRS